MKAAKARELGDDDRTSPRVVCGVCRPTPALLELLLESSGDFKLRQKRLHESCGVVFYIQSVFIARRAAVVAAVDSRCTPARS